MTRGDLGGTHHRERPQLAPGGHAGIGALIGVLAHSRREAFIGTAVGRAPRPVGAGATNHARNIVLPAESLVNFRLAQPLRLTLVSSSGRGFNLSTVPFA